MATTPIADPNINPRTGQPWSTPVNPGQGGVVPRVPPVLPPGAPPPITIPPRPPNGPPGVPTPPWNPRQPGGPPAPPPGDPRGGGNPATAFGVSAAPGELRAIDQYTQANPAGGGNQIANNPAVTAAINDFNLNAAPTIENQMALSGLGRTSATANALARAQASMLTPLYQQSLNLADAAAARQAAAVQSQAAMLLGYGQDQTNRLDNAIQQSLAAGQDERAIRQQYGDAAYNDFMRRQALSEESTYGPFGQTVGSQFGSTVHQSK